MVLNEILTQLLTLTSDFNPNVAVLLFLLTFIGEIVPFVPYVIETLWLVAGFQYSRGILPFSDLIYLFLAAQIGRQIGAMVLYSMSGRDHFKLIAKYKRGLSALENIQKHMTFKFVHNLHFKSPFSIAFGRLIGLHIPLTMLSAIRKKLRILLLGILVSSIASDVTFMVIGFVAHKNALSPVYAIFYSLVGLTAIYVAAIMGRRFLKSLE